MTRMSQKSDPSQTITHGIHAPPYPLHGYIAFAWIKNSDYQACYPLDLIHATLPDVYLQVEEFEKEISGDVVMDDSIVIMPISLRSLFPLEARFWQKPKIHYDSTDRVKLLLISLEYYRWHQVVVIPKIYQDTAYFSAVVATPISGDAKNIESFMLLSDYPVDEQLSCAGIYALKKPFAVNWKTREATIELPFTPSRIQH